MSCGAARKGAVSAAKRQAGAHEGNAVSLTLRLVSEMSER